MRFVRGRTRWVTPEATISHNLELREFKTARMALEAQVPIIPPIVGRAPDLAQGSSRACYRGIGIVHGDPGSPCDGEAPMPNAQCRAAPSGRSNSLPRTGGYCPSGEHWVPRRLGGSAPTVEVQAAQNRWWRRAARKRGYDGVTSSQQPSQPTPDKPANLKPAVAGARRV